MYFDVYNVDSYDSAFLYMIVPDLHVVRRLVLSFSMLTRYVDNDAIL